MGTPMVQYGNGTTYNVENVLRTNIINSEYFRDTCGKLATWEEVVDEIFYSVGHVEPWMSGNARGASTAFCLLYRLFTLKISEDEVQRLLDHEDSPYIRAIGFLYLRYVGDPKTLWEWVEPYVRDDQSFCPSGEDGEKDIPMGAYVRDVFLEQYYFETIFPRIPKPVQDSFIRELGNMGLPTKAVGNAGQGGADRRGIEEGNRRPASVKASLSVAFGQRAPNRSGGREEGRGLGAGMKGGVGAAREARDPHDSKRSPHRPSDAGPRPPARDRDRDNGRARDRVPDRDRDRSRDFRDKGRDKDRERDRDRDRDRDRYRYRNGDRGRDVGRDRERDRDRHYGRDHGKDRDRDLDRDTRDRPASNGRDTRDVFREAAVRVDYDKLKDRYL